MRTWLNVAKAVSVRFFIFLIVISLLVEPNTIHSQEVDTGVQSYWTPYPIQYESDKWAVIPEWTATPTIDGELNEIMWQDTARLDRFQTAYNRYAMEERVEYRIAYDQDYLYIGGNVVGEEAATLNRIEVLLRPAGGSSYYVVQLPMATAQSPVLTTIWNPSPDVTNLSADEGKQIIGEFLHATLEQPEQLNIELAIPLTAIAPAGVAPGDEWQFNIVHVHNLYTQPLNSWVPIRQSDHWHESGPTARVRVSLIDQDRMGSVFFSRVPDHVANAGQEVIVWDPEQTETQFFYHSFTDKQMTFSLPLLNQGTKGGYGGLTTADVQLLWKEPGQSWQGLTDVHLSRSGNLFTLNFSHPAPRNNGMYDLMIVLSPNPSSIKRIAIISFDREDLIEAGSAAYSGSDQPSSPSRILEWSAPSTEVERIMSWIPPQPGFTFVGLPEMPDLYPGGLYQLSSDGHSLLAPRTGTVYPNEQFKEDKELLVTNGKGEMVSIPYYEDAAGKQYFITAHMWYLQKSRVTSQLASLAKNDPLGATRVLYEFAQAYEGYNPTVDRVAGERHANLVADIRSGPPYAYWGGILNRWWYNDLTQLTPLIRAYDELKQTNAFELLSVEVGEDVEASILQKMFLPSIDFVLTYPNYLSNMSFQPWKGLIEAGKVLGEPDHIHRVVELVEDMVSQMFLSDGYWQEVSQSYHLQTVAGLVEVANQLRGYSDPPGYISPRTGERFDNLDLNQKFPVIQRAIEGGNKLVYPDGKVLPITDTWASGKPPNPQFDAGSFLLPAAKIGRFTGGEGRNQTQLYLGFQPKYGHIHYDPLNLSLYAQGQELLPDLGYTHNTYYRWFALSTMSHNTVVVDSKNMENNAQARHGGNIEVFVDEANLFQTMRASYESAYPVTDEYNREPWYIPFADGTGEQGYILDLFRVSGGDRHEYTLNGDANRDAYFATDMPLTEYGPYLLPPGTDVVLPRSNSDSGQAGGHYPGYIYVRDVQQAQLDGDQYALTLVTEEHGTEQAKLQILGLLEPGHNELYLGRSPSLRSIRLQGNSMDNNDEAEKYTMPKMVLRREGTDLESTFVTVLEPFQGNESRIEAIDRLQLDLAPEGAVAVRIAYGDTMDIVLSNPHHPEQPLIAGDIMMTGEMGFIRLIDGNVQEMSLVGGTWLQKGEHQLSGDGAISGTILETKRVVNGDLYDALVVDGTVSPEAIGQYIIITHPDGTTSGYKIGDVLHEDGKSMIVLAEHDPGFSIYQDGTSQQMYYPALLWSGPHTFKIVNVEEVGGFEPPPSYVDPLQAVTLFSPQRHLIQGETVPLNVYGVLASGMEVSLSRDMLAYRSSDHEVLHVDEEGLVTAISEGTAWLTVDVTLGGVTRSATLFMSVQSADPGVSLLNPPTLNTPSGSVHPGDIVVWEFGDDPLWREQINGVSVNGLAVTDAVYSVTEGMIILAPEVWPGEGRHWLTIHAEGYRHAAAEQLIISKAALQDLQLNAGTLSPEFTPDHTDYAVVVDEVFGELHVIPTAYDANAQIEYAGQSYRNGEVITIPVGMNGQQVQLNVSSSDSGSASKTYMTTIYQSGPPMETGTITGTVYGPNHMPMSHAVVNLTGYTTVTTITDEDGKFTLSQVPTGWQRVTARRAGYARAVSSVVYINAGQSVDVSLTLTNVLPPELLDVTPVGVLKGDDIHATSSSFGYIYLVPADTPPVEEEIEAAVVRGEGVGMQSIANTPVVLETTYLSEGKYKVYAVDDHGLVSVGHERVVLPFQMTWMEDTSPFISYTGRWDQFSSSNYSGGTMMLGREKGAYVDIPFYGSGAKLIADRHTARGIGNIYVDGELVTTVDFYHHPILYKQEVFDTGMLEEGVHVIRIEAVWERHPNSTGSIVSFDALQIVGGEFGEVQLGSAVPLVVGESLTLTSTMDGTLFLVPEGTTAARRAIEDAADGRMAPVLAGVPQSLDTNGMTPGWYKAYVITDSGRVALGSKPIAIIDPTRQPALIDDGDPIVRYEGDWRLYTNSVYQGGTMMLSFAKGSFVEIPFYGTSATLITDLHTSRGKGNIYIDDVFIATVDFYRSPILYRQEAFHTGPLTEGAHVLRIEMIGERSGGSAALVPFDALKVFRD